MATEPRAPSRRPALSIRVIIGFWGLTILASCVLVVLSCYHSHSRLDGLAERILGCALAAEAANEFEATLSGAWREHTHWEAMGNQLHFRGCVAALNACTRLAEEMQAKARSSEDRALAERLHAGIRAFGDAVQAHPYRPEKELSAQFSVLLATVQGLGRRNLARMSSAKAEVDIARARADLRTTGLVSVVSLLLGGGVLLIIRRIVRPASELTRAARRFGQGDLTARAAVCRLDELGEVARTFNDMAEHFENQEKERLDFIASVTHDLKSPMVVITGAAQLLKRKGCLAGENALWVDRIIVEGARLGRLADELMDRVQIATGRFSLKLGAMDLTEFLRSLCREQAEVLPTHRLVFEGDEPCPVVADAGRIERVAHNLLSNAAKYSPDGSTIRVNVRKDESRAVFLVQDEGTGMAPDEAEGLFRPYQRSERAREMASGTGLGLCAVKKIVDAHAGTITIHSTPDVGTTVEVGIPCAPAARHGPTVSTV